MVMGEVGINLPLINLKRGDSMGDRSAEMLNIMIAIIAVVALMALGFAVFTISKRMANNSQNDLVNQLSDISQSLYTDLDQKIVTGARVKQVVKQAQTTDCAVLINTLALSGATLNVGGRGTVSGSSKISAFGMSYNGGILTGGTNTLVATNLDGNLKAEASTNGQLYNDAADKGGNVPKCPITIAENFAVITSLNTPVFNPVFVNYGSILKNSITGEANVDAITPVAHYSNSNKCWVTDAAGITGWGNPAQFAQSIMFKDGAFITKLEFATNSQTSRILRYDSIADFDKSGKTMSISDTQMYNSYILQNAGGDYVGLVFIQIRK